MILGNAMYAACGKHISHQHLEVRNRKIGAILSAWDI